MRTNESNSKTRRAGAFALAALVAGCLSFPSLAFAVVKIDSTELAQGENAVGGGTATLTESVLDVINVTAATVYTDENLTMNFNGGNDIHQVEVASSAEVEMNFTGENEVTEVYAKDNSDVTLNADGHNEFEEIVATDNSNMTINVTGENDFEEITGYDNANITVRGTDCQKKDILNLGEDEKDSNLSTSKGALVIDHVTVNLEADATYIGSESGDVRIDTSKVALDDDAKIANIYAGGKMDIIESVIETVGTVSSVDKMTINHSDVEVDKPSGEYGPVSPYRVFSKTGVELINEENGEVREGEIDGKKVYYVDTDDGDKVDLEADGDPAYYKCKDKSAPAAAAKALPKTADTVSPYGLVLLAFASVATALFAARRRQESCKRGKHANR